MKKKLKSILSKIAAFAASAVLLASSAPMAVHAAGALSMSTSYPGISVTAGETVSYSLDFDNETGSAETAELSEVKLPDGWTGEFTGGSNVISSVYLKSGQTSGGATYKVSIPADAAEGDYEIVLRAETSSASADLTLTLKIDEEEGAGTSNLTTEYAEQEGASGTSFTFSSTIQNNTGEEQTYSFTADAPLGWTVSFTPSGESTQVASIDVDAKSSQTMSIKVTPSDTVEAGEYTIPVSAISASDSLSTELKVTITGTYGMTVGTPDSSLSFNVTPDKEGTVTLDVTNTGNIDLENINLTATTPTDWTAEFSESTIETLAAGQTKEITMTVTPSGNALTGDYELDVKASNSIVSQTAAFRVTVKNSTTWGVVGIALIAAVIAGLVFVFHKFGRH